VNSNHQKPCRRLNTFHVVALLVVVLCLGACTETEWQQVGQVLTQINNGPQTASALSLSDIDAGLKEALRVGTENVVGQLGKKDGFNADPAIRIPLPAKLAAARTMMGKIGLGGIFKELLAGHPRHDHSGCTNHFQGIG